MNPDKYGYRCDYDDCHTFGKEPVITEDNVYLVITMRPVNPGNGSGVIVSTTVKIRMSKFSSWSVPSDQIVEKITISSSL